jgi:hypothetical protein
MAFSFEVPKPQNIKKTLLSTRQKIISGGGTFSGDENAGRFSGSGVDGVYHTGNSAIKITITKKPMLYPESTVKNAIVDYFREV